MSDARYHQVAAEFEVDELQLREAIEYLRGARKLVNATVQDAAVKELKVGAQFLSRSAEIMERAIRSRKNMTLVEAIAKADKEITAKTGVPSLRAVSGMVFTILAADALARSSPSQTTEE